MEVFDPSDVVGVQVILGDLDGRGMAAAKIASPVKP
jgi:hypothetical protein